MPDGSPIPQSSSERVTELRGYGQNLQSQKWRANQSQGHAPPVSQEDHQWPGASRAGGGLYPDNPDNTRGPIKKFFFFLVAIS